MTSGTTGGGLTPVAHKRSTRLAIERDARAILADIEDNFAMHEILKRHGWTRNAYYRRLRLAEQIARGKDDPQRIIALILKRQARYETLQRHAEARAEELQRRLAQPRNEGHQMAPREEAALTAGLLKMLNYIGECEERIHECEIKVEHGLSSAIPSLDKQEMAELQEYLKREREQRKNQRAKRKISQNVPQNAVQTQA
jgi:hypothetical protein